jgi:hypothetical protein
MGKKAVKTVRIAGETFRVVRATAKRLGRSVRGYRLQSYGRTKPGKRGWMNVGGGFRNSMAKMNSYVKNLKKSN